MAISFGNDKSHLEGVSGAFSYMASANVQEPPVRKLEENVHTAKERPVDLSSVSCWC